MAIIQFEKSRIDILEISKSAIKTDVLRLDVIHPVISGNKWFKLKNYIKEAKDLNKKIIITFGGAYSNHIIATAAAAKKYGFKSVGIIKSHQPAELSHTLKHAINFGMQIQFSTSEETNKKIISNYPDKDLYIINMGGYGMRGKEGAKDILAETNTLSYSHIICAAGTGTMLAGITEAALIHQKIIGINVLKNNSSIQNDITGLLPGEKHKQFCIIHDYHFGGYAKHTPELINFMNDFYKKNGIPSDFVYTGKLFFAVHDLIQKNFFSEGSNLLIIHSGGLQGNNSLPKGTLIF